MTEQIYNNIYVRQSIQRKGFYVGERIIEIYEGEETTEQLAVHEIAVKVQQLYSQLGIESVCFRSYNAELNWDMILELINFFHERIKITVMTKGDEIIPTEILKNDRAFVSIEPSFDEDYEYNMLDHNNLRMVKREFWQFEYIFRIDNDDDERAMLEMLNALVVPKRISVAVYSDAYEDLSNRFLNKNFPVCYDIRVLPVLNV